MTKVEGKKKHTNNTRITQVRTYTKTVVVFFGFRLQTCYQALLVLCCCASWCFTFVFTYTTSACCCSMSLFLSMVCFFSVSLGSFFVYMFLAVRSSIKIEVCHKLSLFAQRPSLHSSSYINF